MCGIAGVVAWDEKYRVKREQLQRLADALAHRGPDGEGFYVNFEDRQITSANPQCGFAFRRLAIIDPDPRSNQPFRIGDLALVFNGEIYNYRELRAEISQLRPDYQWRTQGDAEVLLMSYQVWRQECVERLNGMFALAVWDDQTKSLFLARDRMGQKPLYVASHAGAVAFSSELGALRRLPCHHAAISLPDVAHYLAYGYTLDSIYRGVKQAPPGSWLTFSGAGATAHRYFDADVHVSPPAEPQRSTRRLVEQAVTRQLVSDVPLGVLLSGGIDSSVVAACARRCGPLHTFSIAFDDPRYDERSCAAAVAKHLGTEHHEFLVRPRSAEDLPVLAAVFGEPFADSSMIPTHYLAREARRSVTVALGGDGGDELFGGYGRYRAVRLAYRMQRLVPELVHGPLSRLAGGDPKATATRVGRFFKSLSLPAGARYASYLRYFDDHVIANLLREPVQWKDDVACTFDRHAERAAGPAEAALACDRMTYLPADLLTKVDRAGMLHALEVRCPFMDHELVQFAGGLTSGQLFNGGPKRMLREAFAQDLPDFVFKRPKMGFAVPIGDWFRADLRPMLRENLFASDSFGKQHFNMKVVERMVEEHESQRVDHSQRLYALMMLELWWRWHKSAPEELSRDLTDANPLKSGAPLARARGS
jgi:asparagine synthase (glutamine-hydrolysing)